MLEPTEVEIRVAHDGTVTPVRFRWQGIWLQIAQVGRRWSDEAGDHWLVMPTHPMQGFELIRSPDAGWQVKVSGAIQNFV